MVPPSPDEVASWATLPGGTAELEIAGIAPSDAAAIAGFYERTLARTTFDVNALTCRDASQRRTIIPSEADIAFSLRIAYGQDPAAVWQALVDHWTALLPAGAELDPARVQRGLVVRPRAAGAAARAPGDRGATGWDCALVRTGGAIPLLPALQRPRHPGRR